MTKYEYGDIIVIKWRYEEKICVLSNGPSMHGDYAVNDIVTNECFGAPPSTIIRHATPDEIITYRKHWEQFKK